MTRKPKASANGKRPRGQQVTGRVAKIENPESPKLIETTVTLTFTLRLTPERTNELRALGVGLAPTALSVAVAKWIVEHDGEIERKEVAQ